MSEYPIRLQSMPGSISCASLLSGYGVRPDADAQIHPNGKSPVVGADRAGTLHHPGRAVSCRTASAAAWPKEARSGCGAWRASIAPGIEWKVPPHGKIVSVFDIATVSNIRAWWSVSTQMSAQARVDFPLNPLCPSRPKSAESVRSGNRAANSGGARGRDGTGLRRLR